MASLVHSPSFKTRWSLNKFKSFQNVYVIVACVAAFKFKWFCKCWQGLALGSAYVPTYRIVKYSWRKVRQLSERKNTENVKVYTYIGYIVI